MTMNKTPVISSAPLPTTLEDIRLRKVEVLNQIHRQKEIINVISKEILAPIAPAANKANALMRAFNTGMAVFDGVMIGLKLMKRARKMFR